LLSCQSGGACRLRFLRNEDRSAHASCYPRLRYPELYLLSGGYRAFCELHPALCRPHGAYRPMRHADHAAELRHFRAKSRSWPAAAAAKHRHHQRPAATLSTRRHSLMF